MNANLKSGLRKIIIWINRLSMVGFAVLLTLICTSSVIFIDFGKTNSAYILNPIERKKLEFEDSELYHDVLRNQIADISRMCVIRNQMESNGKYNGKKIIDISDYANREEVIDPDEVSAEYYLDDLIKWGNYGFDYETVHTNDGNKSILYQRYLTVEGKELSSYAVNDEEYRILVENLIKASSELFLNYTEYVKYQERYDDPGSNIIYCYGFNQDGKMNYYSNLNKNLNGLRADDISSMFAKYDHFISYYPDKMQMNTNTKMNAQDMRNILSQYEYSFQDGSRVWIAIPTDYQHADLLQLAHNCYEKEEPYFLFWVLAAVFSFCIFIYTFYVATKQEGRYQLSNKSFSKLSKFDRIPLELYIISFVFLYIVIVAFMKNLFHNFLNYETFGLICFVAVFVFLIHLICSVLYLSIVRKIKNKTLFKESILVYLFQKIKKGALDSYDHGHLIARTWIPYLLFLVLNLILVLVGTKGIIVAFIFDIIVGIYLYMENKERQNIIKGIEIIKDGDFTYKVAVKHIHGDNLQLANSVNSIGEAISDAVESSMKNEKMKADLITNVSHDLKTPLTSIISYVDLLKREQIDNERIINYISVLDVKSQRLKQLTDDLVEASKISSGNLVVQFSRINFVEFIYQTLGEFSEKFDEKHLSVVTQMPEEAVFIKADSRHLFRVVENLYNNVYKYAMEGTRVYINMELEEQDEMKVCLSIKNISANPLNISVEELTERFVQGDESRMTEGSGLGLSIAKNLVESLEGNFRLQMDGDLFKVILTFNVID